MSQVVIEPEAIEDGIGGGRWMVVIYDNDTNSVDEVVSILILATGCDLDEANIETWEAHTFGKAAVHFGGRSECEDAAASIASIGVKTEVTLEWED